MKALLGFAALFLFQLAPGAPAAAVVLPDPPTPSWIEILDLRLDRATAAELGIGDVAAFDEVDAHVRAWSGPEGGLVVAIGVLLPDPAQREDFIATARRSVAGRGQRLEDYPDLPGIERYEVVDEGVLVEATVFTVGEYGFSIQSTGDEARSETEGLIRRQLSRVPEPRPATEDDESGVDLVRAVGGAAGLALVGTAAWVWWRRGRGAAEPNTAARPEGD